GVDLGRFRTAPTADEVAAAKAAFGVSGKFVVLYLGAHGVAQGLDRLLPAVADAGPRTAFLFVGDGAEKPRVMAEAERLRLGDRVTGATGFSGRRVVAALRRAGHDVTAFVRATSDRRVIAELDVPTIEGDLAVPRTLEAALLHLDAERSGCALVNVASLGFGHA